MFVSWGVETTKRFTKEAISEVLDELCDVYGRVSERNAELDSYYEGTVMVPELGLTIDRSDFKKARSAIACYWPE